MKYVAILGILLIPCLASGQAKSATPATKKTTASTSSCKDNADGLHLTLSGKDYDEESVTNVNGTAVFTNVPAGDMVITKTGEDKSSTSCHFQVVCDAGGRSCMKTGTFAELIKGASFRMTKPGNVTFSVK